MTLELHVVDAFGDGPFTGNPAGVVLLDEARDATWMQRVAMELNQAETAFVEPRGDGFGLRWFTPRSEVDLCGHATLATAHVLWERGVLPPGAKAAFSTRSGVLTATRDGDAITLDFPAIHSRPVAPPADLDRALGVTPRAVLRGDFDLLCVLDSADAVRSVTPDLAAVAAWPTRGVVVTARDNGAPCDFVSRCFFPALGIPEDPATGSAHCALAVYWSEVLGRDVLVAHQASARGATLRCRRDGARVHLTGHATITVRGTLLV